MTDPAETPVLQLRHITKRFPGVIANDDISLAFHRGEVHAILGENGAGKSTFISMLAGMQEPDEGTIEVDGEQVRIRSPQVALEYGIGTVYQHSHLIPSLTVLENLMLGGSWTKPRDPERTLARFNELCGLLNVSIDPDARVARIDLGQQQQVEIIRALWHGQRVLILDEPTSMLTPQGAVELAEVVRRLGEHGVAVLFITHKLGEACDLADRITVLRGGRASGSIDPAAMATLSRQQIIDRVVEMMFGKTAEDPAARAVTSDSIKPPQSREKTISNTIRIQLNNAETTAETGECPLRGLELTLRPGEIVGIAGVDGNGQKHLAEVLAGQRSLRSGRLLLDGKEITSTGTTKRHAMGIRYVTDERLGEGTVSTHSVATNLMLKTIGAAPYWTRGFTRWKRILGHAREQIDKHDIRTPSAETPIGKLSGGNIQKVLLARELSTHAKLVVFNKPTHGLDLNSTINARKHIRAGAGTHDAALLVISNELDELMQTCDRIAVMESGKVRGVVENHEGAEAEIGKFMTAADGD